MDRVRVETSHGLPSLIVDPEQLEAVIEALLLAALARSQNEIVLAAEPHSDSSVRISLAFTASSPLPARLLHAAAMLMWADGVRIEVAGSLCGETMLSLTVPTWSA